MCFLRIPCGLSIVLTGQVPRGLGVNKQISRGIVPRYTCLPHGHIKAIRHCLLVFKMDLAGLGVLLNERPRLH